MTYYANFFKNKSGQLKIQQMAFMLVALFIFFGIVALFYFTISLSGLRAEAGALEEREAKELVRRFAGTPEFTWTESDCSGCIDFDKVFLLKERKVYVEYWKLNFLRVKRIYPNGLDKEIECTRANYPDCNMITLIENENIGAPFEAFVSICRWESLKGGYNKCEIGSILASGRGIAR